MSRSESSCGSDCVAHAGFTRDDALSEARSRANDCCLVITARLATKPVVLHMLEEHAIVSIVVPVLAQMLTNQSGEQLE